MYHHWGYTSIYRPRSYPFRSLVIPMKNIDKFDVYKKKFHHNILNLMHLKYSKVKNFYHNILQNFPQNKDGNPQKSRKTISTE